MTRLFAGTPFDIPPTCDDCGKLEAECVCDPEEKRQAERERERLEKRVAPALQTARVAVEKRGGHKRVTVVRGLTSEANDLPSLLKQLQAVCGTGGTVKAAEDLLELQGDHRAKICDRLREIGYRVK